MTQKSATGPKFKIGDLVSTAYEPETVFRVIGNTVFRVIGNTVFRVIGNTDGVSPAAHDSGRVYLLEFWGTADPNQLTELILDCEGHSSYYELLPDCEFFFEEDELEPANEMLVLALASKYSDAERQQVLVAARKEIARDHPKEYEVGDLVCDQITTYVGTNSVFEVIQRREDMSPTAYTIRFIGTTGDENMTEKARGLEEYTHGWKTLRRAPQELIDQIMSKRISSV